MATNTIRRHSSMRLRTSIRALGAAVACLLVAACSAPFGVRRASPQAVQRALTANVLTTGELSNFTAIALHRRNLTDGFREQPAETLDYLRGELRAGRLSEDELFSLAELSFHYAAHGGGKPYYLAAAAYAYAYEFPEDAQSFPSPIDPRQRTAVDLYNRALTEAFESADGEYVDLAAATYPLPFGAIDVSFDERQLVWGKRILTHFVPAAELQLVGFENRYRQPGVGVPLAAATRPIDPQRPVRDFVGPNVHLPVTAFLRLPEPRQQILGDRLHGALELYSTSDQSTTTIDEQSVPLEQEPTAALALGLSVAKPWQQDLGVFFGNTLLLSTVPTFGTREPHRRGRIPVVFVHGTASNFSVWANMINDLDSDPVIRKNFEFWFFRYDSGQPILYSGMLLRRALRDAVNTLQVDGPDPCLNQMVVIGHSQGGLLVKLTAIHSGDAFWRNASDKPFDEVELSDETRTLLGEAMFVEPLPFVRRVVFVATPQRGSYLAGPDIVRRLAQRLITMPATLVRTSAELFTADSVRSKTRLERVPTSIDNMSPRHPFILAISKIPVSPDIPAHSIIGVVGDGPIEEGGDGVVRYSSAHIEGVESELVVPYEHSMQSKPEVVAEMQRILHEHLRVDACGGADSE